MRAFLVAAFLLLPALAAAGAPPLARAQVGLVDSQLTVSALDPGGTGLAVGAETPIMIIVTYRAAIGGQPSVDPATSNPTPTKVRFEVVKQPSWVNATRFEPLEANVTVPASGNAAANVTLYLSVAPVAPARVREELVVKATAEPNGNIRGSTAESPPIKLRARVITKVNVTAAEESPVFVPGGRWVKVPFTVRNDGNDEVTALLNVTTRPEDSQVAIENRTLVLPRGGSATVEVALRMPWTYGSVGTLELEAQPLAADEEPSPARASVDVNAQSAVPAPPPVVLLLAGVAAALLARRGGRRGPGRGGLP